MWVERIELTNYGGVQGENIIFAQDKLNLVVEPNEYGKSTMATAIWSILYDFPNDMASAYQGDEEGLSEKEARRPKKGAGFSGRLDVYATGRRLSISRNFNSNKFQVFDKEKNNIEVTSEFYGPNGEDELGLRLTGMTRELFRSTCFIGQRELDEHAVGGESSLVSLVQGIADSATPSATSAQAVKVLKDVLDRVPVGEKRMKFDTLIRDLEMMRQDLLNKIRAYERDKQDVAASFDRLMIVNKILAGDNSRFKATEYQNLKFQLYDAASRLKRLQEILVKKFELEEQMEKFNGVEEFPEDLRRAIDELFERRAAKMQELQNVQNDTTPHQKQYEEKRAQIKRRYQGLDKFSQEEASTVASLAGSMHTVEEELTDLTTRRDIELRKLAGENASAVDLESMRNSLISVEAEGIENARSYSSLITAFQDQITEAERNLHKERAKKKEYEQKLKDEVKRRKLLAFVNGGVSFILFVLALVLILVIKSAAFIAPVLFVVGLVGVAVGVYFVIPAFRPEMLFKTEFNQISTDIGRITTTIQELITKVGALEIKLDTLARKVGLQSRDELLGKLDDYAQQSAKLKAFDVIDQMLEQKKQVMERYKSELERHVTKAGRSQLPLNANTAKQLSTALSTYLTESRQLEVSFQSTTSSIRKVAHLEEDILDTEHAIANLLTKAGIELPENVTEGIEQVNKRLNSHHEFMALSDELNELEHETGGHFVELPATIKNLEEYRARVQQQLQTLREQFPDIETVIPAGEDEVPEGDAADLSKLDALRQEREDLQLRIRTLSSTCDEQYLHCIEELDLTEFKLQSAKRAKLALELSRDTLKRLSGENYIDWSSHLNTIARDMLSKLGLDYEEIRFDNELKLIARKKGDTDEISSSEIMSQLSIGTKEQLHWLARMVVSKFLSRQHSMPIIMDEPFSEADDERFLKMMRFLISVISKEHQIIIFSCHQQRHSWFKNQLEENDRGRLIFCRRQRST
ncbi:MAG: AAA family ATPase [Cyanobacteria bacterium SZAS TMP-1]|nr:AAA family ATPase [Cyanobacteria bacterium SZAS TMP-1]